MKKLFSIVVMIFLVTVLTGCTTSLENRIDELETLLETANATLLEVQADLEEAVDDYEDLELSANEKAQTIQNLEQQIQTLEAQLKALQEAHFDNIITFSVTDVYGVTVIKTAGYDDDYDQTLFELLDDTFELEFSDTDYGPYITKIGHAGTRNGNYLAFYKNSEMSMVGVDTQTFADKDVFEFKVEWWDGTEEAVFNALQLFINNQLHNYLNDTMIDFNVLLACEDLCGSEYSRTNLDVNTYVTNMTLTTYTDYFKAIMLVGGNTWNSGALYTGLNGVLATGPYGQTAYNLLGMDSDSHGEDYDAFVTTALDYFRTNTPYDEGLDTGGISLVALAKYKNETGIQTLIDDYVQWIKDDQLPSGGIMTRDMGWGSTENASSISMVILGLVAVGENPAGDDYKTATSNLVLRLTEFQTETGTFDWDLTDDIPEDAMFSTPQAFLALATYYKFSGSYGVAQNPYIFN